MVNPSVTDLENLSAADLRKLQSAVANELETRARVQSRGDDGDSLMILWHEAIVDTCGSQQTLYAWKLGSGKHARKHLGAIERFTDHFFAKGRRVPAPARYFARAIVVQCVIDYLRSIDITATVAVVSKQMGNASDAVEHSFPGYARSGFLRMVYDRYTTVIRAASDGQPI